MRRLLGPTTTRFQQTRRKSHTPSYHLSFSLLSTSQPLYLRVMGIGLLRRHLIGTKGAFLKSYNFLASGNNTTSSHFPFRFTARGRVLEVAAGTGRNLDFYKFGETDLPWWLKLLGSAVEGEVTELVLSEKSQSMAKVASKKVARLSAASSFEQIKVDVGEVGERDSVVV